MDDIMAAPTAATTVPAMSAPPAANLKTQKPFERPAVLGATPPPPQDVDPEKFEMVQAIDEAARQQGYASAEEDNAYLMQQQEQQNYQKQIEQEMEQPAPGIRKPPACLPPGAYPGDRTEKGRELKLAQLRYGRHEDKGAPQEETPKDPARDNVETTYIKRSEGQSVRPADGCPIAFRTTEDGAVQTAEIGGDSLPWALEVAAQRMKAGDIVDVVGRGEHAFADNEEVEREVERRWCFELITVEVGRRKDKFAMDADERIERANELRLKGNDMFKRNRLLRAMNYYERGSSLLDVLGQSSSSEKQTYLENATTVDSELGVDPYEARALFGGREEVHGSFGGRRRA